MQYELADKLDGVLTVHFDAGSSNTPTARFLRVQPQKHQRPGPTRTARLYGDPSQMLDVDRSVPGFAGLYLNLRLPDTDVGPHG